MALGGGVSFLILLVMSAACSKVSEGDSDNSGTLAAALIPNPELLFLDEPFEGVDAVASRVLRDTLRQCVKRGATVFLTSHVLEIVEKLCTDVGIIAKGQMVHQGTMEELRRDGSLEDKFLAVVGDDSQERQKLSWLEA